MAAETSPAGLLRIAELTKSYGRVLALSDVAFSIRPGEVLGVIGPNGAGKTTLFECLAGVLPTDRGIVTLDGRALTPRDINAQLFYVPDGIAPWPSQSVRWALDYVIGFFGGPAARRERRHRASSTSRRCSTRRSARCRKASANASASRSAC